MSYTIPVLPRPTPRTAFQLVEGHTTATQLHEFSDRIRVGHYDGDDTRLVYVVVRTLSGDREAHYGDWIVKDPSGTLMLMSGDEFASMFAPDGDDAQTTLRSRDANSVTLRGCERHARELVASIEDGTLVP